MNQYRCDRCDAATGDEEAPAGRIKRYQGVLKDSHDVCLSCFEAFQEWMDNPARPEGDVSDLEPPGQKGSFFRR